MKSEGDAKVLASSNWKNELPYPEVGKTADKADFFRWGEGSFEILVLDVTEFEKPITHPRGDGQ